MKNNLIRFIFILIFLLIIGITFSFCTFLYFSFGLPKITSLTDYRPPLKSKILSKDGVILAELGKENRKIVEIDDVPSLIIDAFLSAEDDSFYKHEGVDYLGVIRAFLVNLKAGKIIQGGSTITQQVAKSLLLTRERSITRKIKDLLLAQKIEKKFSKKEILFLYLNQVYLGGGHYGIKAAFRGYFDKNLFEVSYAEAALIAGLLVAPGKYSPYRNIQYAKGRQKYVLRRMYINKRISKEQYDKALNEKIKYRIKKSRPFKAGYFTEYVRQKVVEIVGNKEFLENGFIVQTTLNYNLQKKAEKILIEGLEKIDKRQGFKGPIDVQLNEHFLDYYKEIRKKEYFRNSNYFIINDKFEKIYEIEMAENEIEYIINKRLDKRKDLHFSRYRIGNDNEDKFMSILKKYKKYKAIVISLDNSLRLIYVSIAGVIGIIPYEHFRWAHERIIADKKQGFPYVTRPSSILKNGDVIYVKIKKFQTTLENVISKEKEHIFKKSKDYELIAPQKYLLCSLEQKVEVQGALLSLGPFSGEVISLVGGKDFKESKFNRALQSKRQPGSAFKPLLYAVALENGHSPNTIIHDTPESLGGIDHSLNWKPRNYDGKFKGPITFRESLQKSRNIPTIKIAMRLGMRKIHKYLERINFNAEMPNDLSISLGSFGVTLLELVKAYSIFPNGGRKISPKFILSILDRDGKEYMLNDWKGINNVKKEVFVEDEILKEEKQINPFYVHLNKSQVYDPRLSYIMTNLLKGAILYGTGRAARGVSLYLGGKTGTTSNYVDAWFLGFGQNIVTGVWTGFDNNKTMGFGETGSKSALPIWKEYMAQTIAKLGEVDFKIPLGIINVYINKETGKVTDKRSKALLESFVEGTEPGNKTLNKFFENSQDEGKDIFEDDDYLNDQ